MGSFQITYDDFSGGQYMGPRSTNLPKNTWFGENVTVLPNGQLIPVGSSLASTIPTVTLTTSAAIRDFILIGDTSFMFVSYLPGSTSRMTKTTGIANGNAFPITSVNYTLTGIIAGKVGYDPSSSPNFYYINTTGNIYSITQTGSLTLVSAALLSLSLTNMAMYGYRLLAYGPSSKRLYYSDTTLGTWSASSQYYEFTGNILNVIPRSNDLIVVCDTGVFSVVGVFGTSITIQLLVPMSNITEGMRDATIVNRSVFYLDQQLTGAPDGRIYALNGATSQPVAVMDLNDINVAQAASQKEAFRLFSLNDGKLVTASKVGYAYVETISGTWARLNNTTANSSSTIAKQHQVATPGPNSYNEFFVAAFVDNVSNDIYIHRYIYNVTQITNNDVNLLSGGAAGSSAPTGTVTLPEFFHSKPFTVKEAFVQFFARAGYTPAITVGITPSGMVDLYSSYNGSSSLEASVALTVGTANTNNASITQRYHANNAAKGMGVSPSLTFSNATIKRVILNCED